MSIRSDSQGSVAQPKHYLLPALLASLVAITGCDRESERKPSQSISAAQGVTPNESLSQVTPKFEAPIRTDFGLPFVEVEVAGTNGRERGLFLVDTGFDVNVIDEAWATHLGMNAVDSQEQQLPGGDVQMGKVPTLNLQIANESISGQSVTTAPIKALSRFFGLPLRGVLGHDLLKLYVVRIDYKHGNLQFFDADTDLLALQPNAGWTSAPVEIEDNEVLLPFRIQQKGESPKSGIIKLDTGSATAIGFALNFYEDAELERTAPNFLLSGGVGAGGETDSRVFHIDSLDFAGRRYENVQAGATMDEGGSERRSNAGTIGGPILARQDVVLDYPHGRILLGKEYRPGSVLDEDLSGLWLVTDPEHFDQLYVHQVFDSSPAKKAGLRKGDQVISIDDVAVSKRPLSEWHQRLQGPEGDVVRVEYMRDGKKTVAKVQMQHFLR